MIAAPSFEALEARASDVVISSVWKFDVVSSARLCRRMGDVEMSIRGGDGV